MVLRQWTLEMNLCFIDHTFGAKYLPITLVTVLLKLSRCVARSCTQSAIRVRHTPSLAHLIPGRLPEDGYSCHFLFHTI